MIAHLIHSLYEGCLVDAVKRAAVLMRGSYGLAVISKAEPDVVVLARAGSPLVVGLAEDATYGASDAMALAGVTDRIVFLAEGDVAEIRPEGCRVWGRVGDDFIPAERPERIVHAYSGAADLGLYRHYMQKEIFEQPRAIADTLEGVAAFTPALFGADAEAVFKDVKRLLHRLRHVLLRRAHRQILDRSDRGASLRRRNRERIPLPHERRGPRHAGRHDLAVRAKPPTRSRPFATRATISA